MVNNLLCYSCNNAPKWFEVTAPCSAGSCPVPAKFHKHLKSELVIFLKLYICFLLKFKIITTVKYFSYNKTKLSYKSCVAWQGLDANRLRMAQWRRNMKGHVTRVT
jgi:hypothetical protein